MEFNTVKREKDFLRVFGTEAESYLQGQLSQDVEGLSDGSQDFPSFFNLLERLMHG